MYIITLDGTSASGKSTVADLVAKKLNIVHINSGEAYRLITLFMLNNGISALDNDAIDKALKNNKFEIRIVDGEQQMFLNDKLVEEDIHTNQINATVAQYACIPSVIYRASDMARAVAKDYSLVMEGRNLGTFCFPDAKYKFFIDCDIIERAKRRMQELKIKGADVDFDTVFKQLVERDRLDKTRAVAPLRVPDGCIMLDSTNQTAEQVADTISNIIKGFEKINS